MLSLGGQAPHVLRAHIRTWGTRAESQTKPNRPSASSRDCRTALFQATPAAATSTRCCWSVPYPCSTTLQVSTELASAGPTSAARRGGSAPSVPRCRPSLHRWPLGSGGTQHARRRALGCPPHRPRRPAPPARRPGPHTRTPALRPGRPGPSVPWLCWAPSCSTTARRSRRPSPRSGRATPAQARAPRFTPPPGTGPRATEMRSRRSCGWR